MKRIFHFNSLDSTLMGLSVHFEEGGDKINKDFDLFSSSKINMNSEEDGERFDRDYVDI